MTAPTSEITMIGAYRVLQQLGEGGMGTVYLGEHTLLGRRAAIKVLHPMFSVRPEIVERFFNEARATTSIQDPGIVQIFDFGFHDGTAYIVMEHLVGETLLQRMRRLRRLPEAEMLRLARQIALSLYAAHQRGVVHRDLKPDNIFVVPDPEAVGGERTKVLDFGIAKLIDVENHQHTKTGVVLGTPSYMSPEQCRGSGAVDHRADIYSLGCMMFRCLTGRLVFEAEGSGELIAMHLREPPRAPSQLVPVRPELDAIVLRCLQKSPDDRYRSMHELAADLDHLLRSISVPPGTNLAQLTPLSPPIPQIPTGEIVEPISINASPTTLSSGVGQVASPARAKPRWPLIALVATILVGGGVATVIATTGGKSAPHAAAAPTPQPEPAVTPPITPPVTPAPVEVKPVEVKPVEVKPAEANPPDVKKPPTKSPVRPPKRKGKDEDLYNDR